MIVEEAALGRRRRRGGRSDAVQTLTAKRGCKRKALCGAFGRLWYIHAARDPLIAECRDAAYDETDHGGVLGKGKGND